MQCGICLHGYDSDSRIPRILTKCGHTYCQQCLAGLSKDRAIICQDCKQTTSISSVKELPINHSLMQLPSAVHSSNLCQSHGKPLEAFCLDDLSLVCLDCMLSSKYKDKKLLKTDPAFKDCFQSYSKDCRLCEPISTKGKEMTAQLTGKLCSFEKKASLKQELAAFFDSVIEEVTVCKEFACQAVERDVNARNSSIQQQISNIEKAMKLWNEISESRRLDKVSFLKRYKQLKDDMSAVQKIVTSMGPKMIPDDIRIDSKKELDSLVSALRSRINESNRPSTTPHSTKDKSKKPSIPNISRPQTAINKNPPSKQESIKSPKKEGAKQPSQPQTNNLQQKRAEMKAKKLSNKPAVPTQAKTDKSKSTKIIQITRDEASAEDSKNLIDIKDVTHLTVQILDDQKLSLFGDSVIPALTDLDSTRGQIQRKNYWNKNVLQNLPEDPEIHMSEDESGLTDFRHNNQLQMSESKDQTYNLDRYCETFGRGPHEHYTPINPHAEQTDPSSRLNKPSSDHFNIYESFMTLDDEPEVSNKLFCIGGVPAELTHKLTVDVYDPQKKFWVLHQMQEDNRAKFGCYPLSRSSIVIFGGVDSKESPPKPLSSSLRLDLSSLYATKYTFNLSAPRHSFASIMIKEQLFVIGGNDGNGPVSTVEAYNLSTGEVRRLRNMQVKREQASCAVMDDWIYVAGGLDEKGESLKLVERLHYSTGHWETQQSLLIGRNALSLITANNQLFAIGGHDGEKFLASVER